MTSLAFFALFANKPHCGGKIYLIETVTELADFKQLELLASLQYAQQKRAIRKGFNRNITGLDENFKK